jgi:hypothetical protein
MINPIYKFELNEGQCYPNYSADLAKVYEKESGEEFFRAKLSGSLVFSREDYDYIMSKAFDFRFVLTIYISYDMGTTWSQYWVGRFWKTDCTINEDDKSIEVTPSVVDEYTDILDGMEREYDLIQLAPEMGEIYLDKRGMIQIYTPGESVVGCFLAGMWWEEECSPETDETKLTQTGDGKPNFVEMLKLRFAKITNRSDITPGFYTRFVAINQDYTATSDGYTLKFDFEVETPYRQTWQILRGDTVLWQFSEQVQIPTDRPSVTLTPVSGSGASGDVVLEFVDSQILGRYICDVESFANVTTYELSNEDFVFNNRNYHRVCGYNFPNSIAVSDRLSTTPTKWGIYQPGQYYVEPYSIYGAEFFPVSRTYWGAYSIWFNFPFVDPIYEEESRKQILLKNAYPLYSAISAILRQFAPSITHEGTSSYSEFLYALNPLTNGDIAWFITPKSNILVGEYDQPAQKAPVTLRQILDMLRDCFRCYWFVDNGKFRIEHISFFMNGGAYDSSPNVGRDLTQEGVTRNGKKWAYCTSRYSYDKSDMPSRYEFGWMDDETQYFDGEPINIISNYVDKSKVEKIDVSSFSSDVDFLMLEPSRASKDGFVLLGATTPPKTNIVTSTTENRALFMTGLVATLPGYCVSDFIPVSGKNIRAVGSTTFPSSGYAKYCVYDENQTCIRYGTENDYIYQVGDAYVRFTFNIGNAVAYEYYFYLPYYDYRVGTNSHLLQNGYASFVYLEQFYLYDLPARLYEIGGTQGEAIGIKKGKSQTLNFPCYQDPSLVNLIKTNLGNGNIGKISINLSSRSGEATLKYDTE